MINIPVLRGGEPYESLETEEVIHHRTGEVLASVGQANPGLLARDMRKASRAREVLREFPIKDLVEMMKKAGDLYLNETLPLGDGEQTPDDFARQQSASTGLPEHMCKFNMEKNHFVLNHMDQILDALTRGLDLEILQRGFGVEERGVPISYQAQSPVLGMVLPSNSPGVHSLWLPAIPLKTPLVLKPGREEPWTPYRIAQALLIPAITHQTDIRERREVLQRFREGTYRALVTSRVLNEGVDVPSASVGIVRSGTGSVREHVQRLGPVGRRAEFGARFHQRGPERQPLPRLHDDLLALVICKNQCL